MTSRRHTEGKEMIRFQGCYMYIINCCGAAGAFLGFKTLTVVVPECATDVDPLHAYLKVSRWIYPLAKAFSPIYCWGHDKMIIPEPFSSVDAPVYIVIRLPYGCSDFQKSTLWNLLDMHAHVRGKFCSITEREREMQERHYFLTEMIPFDEMDLQKEPPNQNAKDIKVITPLKYPTLSYKGKPLTIPPAKLAVSLHTTQKVGFPMQHKAFVNSEKCCYQVDYCKTNPAKIIPKSHIRPMPKESSPRARKETVTAGGISHDWVSLPLKFGNILRQYLIGPRDYKHIKVITIPASIYIPQLIHYAVKSIYKQLVRLRHEKELAGIPPSFEGRRQKLLCGFGQARRLNSFGPDLPTPLPDVYRGIDSLPQTYGIGIPYEEALKRQHLESAAAYFDMLLDKCKLLLLSLEPDEDNVNRMGGCELVGVLTPRPIHVRYGCYEQKFGLLMTLPSTEENETIYIKTTNYFERQLEECEHHYPKLRPINPYLDPAYTYSRNIPKYHVPKAHRA